MVAGSPPAERALTRDEKVSSPSPTTTMSTRECLRVCSGRREGWTPPQITGVSGETAFTSREASNPSWIWTPVMEETPTQTTPFSSSWASVSFQAGSTLWSMILTPQPSLTRGAAR